MSYQNLIHHETKCPIFSDTYINIFSLPMQINPLIKQLLLKYSGLRKSHWWPYLFENSSIGAYNIIIQDYWMMEWNNLCSNTNPDALRILEENIKNINWRKISSNSSAMFILQKHLNKINWDSFSKNSHPEAIQILKETPDKICWKALSENSNSEAIQMLKENPDKICWRYLCVNSNPKCIELFEIYYEKYNSSLQYNDIINYGNITNILKNPNIFVYNYNKMKTNMDYIREELMMKALHPTRVIEWINSENEDML